MFTISGHLEDIAPGATSTLQLTVAHEHRFAIIVRTVDVTVGAPTGGLAGGAPCVAEHLTVANFVGSKLLAERSSGMIEVDVTMSPEAPDACQGATFPLSYTGTAIRENQS